MHGIPSRLEAFCSRCAFGIVVLPLTVAMMVFLWCQGQGLHNDVAPQGIVSLQLAGSAARAHAIVESWNKVLPTARGQVWWDFPFIILYAFALFHIGSWARWRALANNLPLLAGAARLAAWSGLAAGLFDIGENIGLLAELNGGISDAVAARTSFCATIKFALIAAAIGVSLPAGWASPTDPAPFTWRSMLRIARASFGVLALVALGLLVPPQTRDMLAGLSVDSWRGIWSAFAFHLSLWFLAFAAWYWSRAVLSAWFGVPEDPNARQEAAVANGAAAPAALDWAPRLLFLAAAAIGAVAALRSAAWWQLAAILVWAGLTLLFLRYRLDWFPAAAPAGRWLDRLRVGEDLRRLMRYAPFGPGVALSFLAVAAILFVLGFLGTFLPGLPFWGGVVAWIGWAFPGPAAVLIFLGLALGPLTVLTYAADGVRLSGAVGGVSWTLRPPVFLSLLAIVLAVPGLINLHAVRVAASAPIAVGSRNNIDELFKKWAETCQQGKRTLRPVIVAVSGGASRAGLWAARVLAEIDAAAAAGGSPIFAISSVSGGSLGAAAYMAALAGQDASACTLTAENRKPFYNAVVDAFGDDALGPAMAGSLFGDVPRALAGVPITVLRHAIAAAQGVAYRDTRGGDRAEALERAFEENWWGALTARFAGWQPKARESAAFSQPFLLLAYAAPDKAQPAAPPQSRATPRGAAVWIANGTDAQNGERVLTVPFNYEAWPFLGALDALALLGRDLPVSTAIHNTARFALLSPSGELSPVKEDKDDKSQPTQLIDGGYFENEGLLTAWELAGYLKDNAARILGSGYSVDPILVQASADAEKDIPESRIIRCRSNDAIQAGAHEGPARSLGRSRPLQATVPLLGLYSVRGGHSDWILREVRLQYCRGEQRFYHFYLYRIGEDVPLNWVLSPAMSCQIWRAMTDELAGKENPNLAESRALAVALGLQAAAAKAMDHPKDICGKPPAAN